MVSLNNQTPIPHRALIELTCPYSLAYFGYFSTQEQGTSNPITSPCVTKLCHFFRFLDGGAAERNSVAGDLGLAISRHLTRLDGTWFNLVSGGLSGQRIENS